MTKLIKSGAYAQDAYAPVDDDAALPDGPVLVSLSRFNKDREALLARNTPVGIRLQSSENPEVLGQGHPSLRAGRAGVSQIPRWPRLLLGRAILRTRLGFTGEIRAVGDFLYDQVNYQHRVGFDAWEVPDTFTIEMFNRALSEMTNVYQPSTDGKKTIRELRAAR